MENVTRSGLHDFHLASRKAEEAALRRYRAVYWLECLIGPLSVPDQPSEREFISCLRNGLILCNAINKIKPGSVPKVVETPLPSQSVVWDSKPLPAYQYFENVRNFLVAVKELQLPAFEASDLETESFEAGSAGRVVDCILALKSYHEWKQTNAGDGFYKNIKSPLVLHSANKNLSRPLNALSTDACRHLNMSAEDGDKGSLEDSIVKAITDYMVETKENISNNLLASFHTGKLDPVKTLSKILASGLEGQLQSSSAEIEDILREWTSSAIQSAYIAKRNLPTNRSTKRCRACLRKGSCAHWNLLRKQEEDLADINALLAQTKKEFEELQSQMLNDMKQLGNQVHNMSTAALGYQQIMQENRNLYNMVQDLKGNIRVYCRIRPIFNAKAKNVIDFIGEDGSLVVVDPSKLEKAGRKAFQFNRVYCPKATQDEIFKDTRPLIRSVMDGYNVCILAYGQTGSGKTYTMCGSSGESTKDMGINYFALNDLFKMSNQRKDTTSYEIHAQMVEIYNEHVRDLLSEDSSSAKYPFHVSLLLKILK
ncbi:hypothetical protein Nepgr_022007 [Nepenthes gracilis]|uniref:Uncharacterized protein n=1 Tax=Nepenthes gracilis TaxID=150966 RepID=A0AAD3T1V4_NEPGR|nr:hypothetical protein Nepgr_022007 [Nepenthes gracilis]